MVRRDSVVPAEPVKLRPVLQDSMRYLNICPLSAYTNYYGRGFSISPLNKSNFNKSNRKELYSGGYGASAIFESVMKLSGKKYYPWLMMSYVGFHKRSINYNGDTGASYKLSYRSDQFRALYAFPLIPMRKSSFGIDPYLGYGMSVDKLITNEKRIVQMHHMFLYGCIVKYSLNGLTPFIYLQLNLDRNHLGDLIVSMPFSIPTGRR